MLAHKQATPEPVAMEWLQSPNGRYWLLIMPKAVSGIQGATQGGKFSGQRGAYTPSPEQRHSRENKIPGHLHWISGGFGDF